MKAVLQIARMELLASIRNRWTFIYASVFAVLILALSYFGLVTTLAVGFQDLTRTSASILSLSLYLIPFIALVMGSTSLTAERGLSELLFAQPVTRNQILLGKLLGLFLSLLASVLIGFSFAGFIIGVKAGSRGILAYAGIVILALLLAFVFLAISGLISVACQRTAKGVGISLLVGFFFLFIYDLLVIGLTVLLPERIGNKFALFALLGNPIGVTRVAGLIIIGGKDLLGSAGAQLLRLLGGEILAFTLLTIALLLYILIPICLAVRLLSRQDI